MCSSDLSLRAAFEARVVGLLKTGLVHMSRGVSGSLAVAVLVESSAGGRQGVIVVYGSLFAAVGGPPAASPNWQLNSYMFSYAPRTCCLHPRQDCEIILVSG